MRIIIQEFDPKKASRDDWKTFHEFRWQYHLESEPTESYPDNETQEKMILSSLNDDKTNRKRFIISIRGKQIGFLFINFFNEKSPSYEENKGNMQFKLQLLKDYSTKKILAQIYPVVVQEAKENKRKNLFTMALADYEKKSLANMGAKVGSLMHENRLYLKDVNWTMMSQWVEDGKKRNNETKLIVFSKKTPEEYLEEFCKTLTFTADQQPRDNLDTGRVTFSPEVIREIERQQDQAGHTIEVAASLEKDGTISGFTILLFLGEKLQTLEQNLTGVLESYRGRKIGKWVKTSLLLTIKEKYPKVKYIRTFNAESNAPMRAINNKLGYKKHSEMIRYQIGLETIEKYIESVESDIDLWDLQISKFDVFNATTSEWKEYNAFRRSFQEGDHPGLPVTDDDSYKAMLQKSDSTEKQIREIYVIRSQKENVIFGNLRVVMEKENSDSYKGNEQNLTFFINVLKDKRRNGIGCKLFSKLVDIAEQYNRTKFITRTDLKDGIDCLDVIGAERALVMKENKLILNDVDWAMIDNWIKEGEKNNPETRLLKFRNVPEDLLEEFCKTATFGWNQSPRDNLNEGDKLITPKDFRNEEKRFELMGGFREMAITLEPDRTVSGITELLCLKNAMEQGMTVVLENYRGKKLGKWIKASLLLDIKRKYNIEFIKTTNAYSNEAMLSINERLGFKQTGEVISYQTALDKLREYVHTKNTFSQTSEVQV